MTRGWSPGRASGDNDVNENAGDIGGSRRLDKWLWHVRLVRTRSAAAELVTAGHVRVNSERIGKPGYALKPGDVVVVVLRSGTRTLKVVQFSQRRGDAVSAAGLYEDLAPPPPRDRLTAVEAEAAPSKVGLRDAGAGRPTKRDRRQLERLRQR